MWNQSGSLDLTTQTKKKFDNIKVGVVPRNTTFLQNIFFQLRKSKDTRLVEKIVWVKWSLKVSLSITFQVHQQFNFPFSLSKWKINQYLSKLWNKH